MSNEPEVVLVEPAAHREDHARWRQMAGVAFVAQGLAGVTQKALTTLEGEYRVFYLFCTYVVAAALSYGLYRTRGGLVVRASVIIGSLSGLTCVLSVYFLLAALRQVGGVVTFSVAPAAALALTLLAGRVIFKERLSGMQLAGVLLAVAGIVLVQL